MFDILRDFGPYFWTGIGYTLLLSFLSLVFGSIIGLLVSLMRLSSSKVLNKISLAYISVLRGTPLFVQLFLVYFGLDMEFGLALSPFLAGLLAVSLNSGAYVAEIIRSGIKSIDIGQKEAGRSLGLTERQTMRHIILPQAVKNILPALGNEFIALIKETSIVSTIGATDIMYGADKATAASYNIKPLLWAAIFYFIITLSLSKVLEKIEEKVAYND